MKLSVALCTYNGAKYLPAQLESLAAQTRRPDELVVCDDRSSDDTVEILRSFAARAAFPIRLSVNESNLGSTKNFERAIELCTGDVIALSDQDDSWLPEKLQRMEAAFASGPDVGLVAGDAILAGPDLTPTPHRLWTNIPFTPAMMRECERGKTFDILIRYNVVTGAIAAFRADLRPIISPIPMNWSHDGWIAALAAAVADCCFISEPLILYRQHAAQQVGMGVLTMKRQLRAAMQMDRLHFLKYAEMFAVLANRLREVRPRLRDPGLVDTVARKVRHLLLRGRMRAINRFARFPLALRELLSGNYHQFSQGLKAFLVDLVLPTQLGSIATRSADSASHPFSQTMSSAGGLGSERWPEDKPTASNP